MTKVTLPEKSNIVQNTMLYNRRNYLPSLRVLQKYCNVALDVVVPKQSIDAGPFLWIGVKHAAHETQQLRAVLARHRRQLEWVSTAQAGVNFMQIMN